MNKFIFELPTGDLASRKSALAVRESLKSSWSQFDVLVVDCKNVHSLSESYADELFGVLVLENGYDKFVSHLKIQSASPQVLLSIASVIKRRRAQMVVHKKNSPINNLSLCNA